MYVSPEIQARVKAKLVECIAILEKRYNRKFEMPTLEYTSATRAAGSANYRKWHIELSAPFLMDPVNVDEMINETTPHELAHLVTFRVYPETMDAGPIQFTNRGLRRGKREVHGPHWQEVMRAMGLNPERCHNMKLSDQSAHAGNVRERVRYEWLCTGCNQVIELGPKHNKTQLEFGGISHRGCGRAKLVQPGTVQPKPVVPTQPTIKAATPKPIIPTHQPIFATPVVKPQTGSKMDVCKQLFAAHRSSSRSEMIALFVARAQCTPAGAATYYATLKKNFA